MDRLKQTDFLRRLSGQVFLTHYQAVAALTPEVLGEADFDGAGRVFTNKPAPTTV